MGVMTSPFSLAHRSVVRIAGSEARALLARVLTADPPAPGAPARPAALLTPQGKIIHALGLHADPDGDDDAVFLDAPAEGVADLVRRMTLYKLRADAKISDVGADLAVVDDFDVRRLAPRADAPPPDPDAYHAARIARGLPEQGADFAGESVFPTDVNLDLLGGVDYAKGCFVGQEVVSRMKRRGSIRKRVWIADFDGDAPGSGTPIRAGGAAIGAVLSSAGAKALALVRTDRLAAADPAAIAADDRPLRLAPPPYAPAEEPAT